MKLSEEIREEMNRDPAARVVEAIHKEVDAAAQAEIERVIDELWRVPALEAVAVEETELAERKARLLSGAIKQPIEETPPEEQSL